SANLRASSGFWATIKLSLVKEMSRQVDWSNDPPCVAEEGGVVGCGEAGVGELEDGVCRDVEPDGDLPVEQPAVMTAMATIPATILWFSLTGHSFAPGDLSCCRHHTGNLTCQTRMEK
ncbi:MAG: hypothetical protein WAO15_06235, partial [Mycobacterium sp.]